MSEPVSDAADIGAPSAIDAEVDETISLCGGDIRAALRATLTANSYLQTEVDRLGASASSGFARRRILRGSNSTEGKVNKVG